MNSRDVVGRGPNDRDSNDRDSTDHNPDDVDVTRLRGNLVYSYRPKASFPYGAIDHVHWTLSRVVLDHVYAFPSIRRLASSCCYINEVLYWGWLVGIHDCGHGCVRSHKETRNEYVHVGCRLIVPAVLFASHARSSVLQAPTCSTRKTVNENESVNVYDCGRVALQPQVAHMLRP